MPSAAQPGTLTLIGSGEMTPSMTRVHRAVMARITGPVRPAFLDTPAGFQLNADQLAAKAVAYFRRHFDLPLSVASFKAADTATPAETEKAVKTLRQANYLFAGPGSPTYTVRHWRDTPILDALRQRLAAGAHLAFASAAAIAVGRYALPVYEIYKVGEPPRWVDGLDLLGPYGLALVIVPHWNNAEGGTHDTHYCFMGEPRWRQLEAALPSEAVVLGIDEHTACTLDLAQGQARVMGVGGVTVRRGGRERRFPAGSALSLAQLTGGDWSPGEPPPADQAETSPDEAPEPDPVEPLVALLIQVRAQLRQNRQWALADQIRDRLRALGIVLEDGPDETTWGFRNKSDLKSQPN